jgi:hypothetical protein
MKEKKKEKYKTYLNDLCAYTIRIENFKPRICLQRVFESLCIGIKNYNKNKL